MTKDLDMKNIINQFNVSGDYLSYEPYGRGHINDTYKVTLKYNNLNVYYIVQRINHNVFRDIDGLMNNIIGVTNHIRGKVLAEGGILDETMYVISTKSSNSHFKDIDGNHYRCYNFISAGISVETKPTIQDLYNSGVGYGRFQNYLNDYPSHTLAETIPLFHNTVDRLAQLNQAISNDVAGRLKDVSDELDGFLTRSHYAPKIVELLNSGEMPFRVTHNDSKLNNILIDTVNNRAVTTIDLDTVMPGSIVYDFGDSIRSGCILGAEDSRDLDTVKFSMKHYRAFCDGFLSQVKNILNHIEIENMALGALLMTYECGIRFLTDYLNGDKYFKTAYNNHNLIRSRTHIALLSQMEEQYDDMHKYVLDICKDKEQ